MASFWKKLGNFFMGEPQKKVSIYDKNQQQMLQQLSQQGMQGGGLAQNPLYQQAGNFYSNILSNDRATMQAFSDPYMQQFQQQIIPGLAEQFAGMGAGAQSSSAFQNALGGAGKDLLTNLSALRASLQMQAAPLALQHAQQPFSNLLSASQTALGRSPFQMQQGTPGFLAPVLGGAMSAIGTGMGGPIGGAIGGALGNKISNWFNPQSGTAASPSLGA